MAMKNFRAADMPGKAAAPTKKPEPAPEPEKKPAPAPVEDAVPEGRIDEILKWVGDDKDKARKAQAAERKNENPRKTLLDNLQKIIDGDK